MVYIKIWTDFQREAEALYAKSPMNTRYCAKWRATENKLVLKMTDDVTCLKYKTSSLYHFQKFLALNSALMERMQNRRLMGPPSTGTFVPDLTSASATSVTPVGGLGATAGGGGKKRGGKKKK